MGTNIRSLISALLIAFLDNFGYSIVFILFAPLVLNPEYGFFSASMQEGVKNTLLGILVGIFPFFLFFGAPFWGDVADLWGRKKALLLTVSGTILGHLITAAAIVLQSYLFLLVARAISGFLAGNISICLATVSDVSPDPKTKGRNFGLLTVFMGMGWILAMIVGGYLSDPTLAPFFTPALPFYIAAGCTLIGLGVVQFLFEETNQLRSHLHFHFTKSIQDIKMALRERMMRPFLYVLLIWSLGWFFTFQWFAPVSIEKYGVTQESVSSHLVFLGLCWIIGGVMINPLLLKKWSSRPLAIVSTFFVAAAVILCSISLNYHLFSFWFALSALAAPVALSNILNEVSLSAPTMIQGKAMGFSQSFQALAGILVPFAGGAIADLSIGAIFPLAALLLILSSIPLFKK